MSPKFPFLVLLLSTTTSGSALAADGYSGSVNFGGRRPIALAKSFEQPMQKILDQLKARGYKPRDVGCFGYRPNNRSAHPSGHACDVDQTGRDITTLNRYINRRDQIQIAENAGAVSGCKWRSPDCGHFEQRSAPYSAAGTRVGTHRYPGYENRPVVKPTRRVSSAGSAPTRTKRRAARPVRDYPTYDDSWIPWRNPYGSY